MTREQPHGTEERSSAGDQDIPGCLEQPANPSGHHERTLTSGEARAQYARGARERTPEHDAAVGGVGHGGPVAPDPVDDESPVPYASAAPGPGGDLPPDEHDPAVHFIE